MSFRLLIISELYNGFYNSYYENYKDIKNKSYKEQYTHILNHTSETVSSYTRTFSEQGIEAHCILTNAKSLQEQWLIENNIKGVNLEGIVFQQVKAYKPEVLWIENISLLDSKWISKLRLEIPSIRLIIASHSAPYNNKMIEGFKNLDFVFTCTPGLRDEFISNGLSSYLVYHAFDVTVLDKINNNILPENDLVFSGSLFTGSGFHTGRIELLEKILKEGFELKIFGNIESKYKINKKKLAYFLIRSLKELKLEGLIKNIPMLYKHEEYGNIPIKSYSTNLRKAVQPSVFGLDMYKLLNHSGITLNIHGEVAGDYAGNMRLFEATGVGSCLLTDNKVNMGELFDLEKEVVVYDNFEDCIEKMNWLMNNEKERKKIAKMGQNRTLNTHTIKNRCELMLEIINDKLRG